MANLLDPQGEYPSLASIEAVVDTQMAIWQAVETPDEERVKAYELYQQALARKSELTEPLWPRAVEMFRAPAHYDNQTAGGLIELAAIIRAEGEDYPFRDGGEFYQAALIVRDALRTLVAKRAERLPIQMPSSAAPRVQIMPDGSIRPSKDLVRDFLLPALEGANIDEIQLCPNCDRLVLAVRKRDFQTCSPECANVERARAFRAKNPDYYKSDERKKRQEISDRKRKAAAKRKAKK